MFDSVQAPDFRTNQNKRVTAEVSEQLLAWKCTSAGWLEFTLNVASAGWQQRTRSLGTCYHGAPACKMAACGRHGRRLNQAQRAVTTSNRRAASEKSGQMQSRSEKSASPRVSSSGTLDRLTIWIRWAALLGSGAATFSGALGLVPAATCCCIQVAPQA